MGEMAVSFETEVILVEKGWNLRRRRKDYACLRDSDFIDN